MLFHLSLVLFFFSVGGDLISEGSPGKDPPWRFRMTTRVSTGTERTIVAFVTLVAEQVASDCSSENDAVLVVSNGNLWRA